MNDYYAAWVHQIKAPIAVMKILLQQQDTRENRELSAELFRVEQYVEMALSYIRLGEGASDLVIRECDLDEIIRKTVRKYAGQFIRRKIRLVYDGTDMKALTDEKWLSFILEQLLSNAVKYTPEGGTVTIAADRCRRISVTDTGSGSRRRTCPGSLRKDTPDITDGWIRSLQGSGCICAGRRQTGWDTGLRRLQSRDGVAALPWIWIIIPCRPNKGGAGVTNVSHGTAGMSQDSMSAFRPFSVYWVQK